MSEIQEKLQEVTELISLPEAYLKVRRLMDDPASDIYDFAEVISVDPNLSTRVLKVVNSAYFGFPEPVESISRAINMIGIGPLHNYGAGNFGDFEPRTAQRLKMSKIDHLFIAGLLHEIGHLVLYSKFPLQTLISMAHSMNMKVIAEGVEEQDQFDLLGEYGVDEIQGYLLSKPANAEALEPMIRNPQQHLGSPANVVQLRP